MIHGYCMQLSKWTIEEPFDWLSVLLSSTLDLQFKLEVSTFELEVWSVA